VIASTEDEPKRCQYEKQVDGKVSDVPSHRADEEGKGADHDAPLDGADQGTERVEPHTASPGSLSMASSRSRLRSSRARSVVSPGMVTSAPRDPAV